MKITDIKAEKYALTLLLPVGLSRYVPLWPRLSCRKLPGTKVAQHAGHIDGFIADQCFVPEKDIACAVLTNSENPFGAGVLFTEYKNQHNKNACQAAA